MVALEWQQNDHLLLYSRISSGFKSGGFNGAAQTTEQFLIPYAAETLKAYELGLKSAFMADRMRVNVALFQNDYEDMQVDTFVPEAIGVAVSNAAEAVMRGGELELIAKLSPSLQVNAGYAYLDAEYKTFNQIDQDDGVSLIDLRGSRYFAYAPRHSVLSGLRYERVLAHDTKLIARIDYSWLDEHHVSDKNVASTDVSSYGVWSGRITLADLRGEDPDTRISLSFWMKNMLDEEYRSTGANLRALTVVQWGEPRTLGLEFTVDY
jgi:iron complex outermembrane receptor protein